MNITCGSYEEILAYLPDLDRKRFGIFRYEDMVADQMRIAEEVYDFLGIEISSSLRDWLEGEEKNGRTQAKVFKSSIIFSNMHYIR